MLPLDLIFLAPTSPPWRVSIVHCVGRSVPGQFDSLLDCCSSLPFTSGVGWINSRLLCFSFSKILPPLKVHFLGLLSTKNVYWAGWDDGRVKTKISQVWERTAHWKPTPDGVSWKDTQDLKISVLTEFSRKCRAKGHRQEEQCYGPLT